MSSSDLAKRAWQRLIALDPDLQIYDPLSFVMGYCEARGVCGERAAAIVNEVLALVQTVYRLRNHLLHEAAHG